MVDSVGIGVAVGLLLGKFLGIYFFTWLAVKAGVAPMPLGMTLEEPVRRCVAGRYRFNVHANLSFGIDHPVFLNQAKFGVLSGSVLSGLLGYLVLRIVLEKK